MVPSAIIIADNSGEFSSFEYSSQIPNSCIVIPMGHNRGYGAAGNEIMSRSIEQFPDCAVLLMTQEARLQPTSAKSLMETLGTDDRSPVVFPLLVFRSNHSKVFSMGGRIGSRGNTYHDGYMSDLLAIGTGATPYEVEWGDGACFLAVPDILMGVGGFDEAYFMYVEEIDLFLRLRICEYTLLLNPSAIAFQEPGSYHLYYKYRNLCYLSKKFPTQIASFVWPAALARDTARAFLRRIPAHELLGAIQGIVDFRRGRMYLPYIDKMNRAERNHTEPCG